MRQNKARQATKHLTATLTQANLDALVVMGDDQNESYKEDCRPAFAVYFGDTIRNSNEQHAFYRERMPDWYVQNRQAFFEQEKPRDYPVQAESRRASHRSLMDEVSISAASQRLPEGEGEGHAIAYVHRRVMEPDQPGPDRAGLPEHVFPAQPAAAAALLRIRPGGAQGGGEFPGQICASASPPRAA